MFGTMGCRKTTELTVQDVKIPDQEAPAINFKRPDVIRNDLAKGDFRNGIVTYIDTENSAYVRREWRFQVEDGTSRVKNLSMVAPPYLCEKTEIKFQYLADGFIDQIISARKDSCAEYVSKWVYKYNYEEKLLVSIVGKNYYTSATADNLYMNISEDFFTYHPDGRVHEIYSTHREASNKNYTYHKISLIYDRNDNVIEVIREGHETGQYDEKFTFTYDDNKNPLEGLYIFGNLQLPSYGYAGSLGPRFLSKNCIKAIKSEYLYHSQNPRIDYYDSKTRDNKVIDFGYRISSIDWMRYFIKY